jgi:bifunctional NMN adenylyltransferase/nudix hydrolase
MLKPETLKADVGVIVGRFQVSELTSGHFDLINTVRANHQKIIIVLGISAAKVSRQNPLDFESRCQMLTAICPSAIVTYNKDHVSDIIWSKNLDERISDLISPGQSVLLYGCRDSFVSHYSGRFPVQRLEPRVDTTGTESRRENAIKVPNNLYFRAGIIWASQNQYPKVFPTVDVAIINPVRNQMLLAMKPGENHYRFVGGFAEGKGSFEDDGRREVMEETGIEIGPLAYIGSCLVDDWRYRKEADKIKTIFFKADHVFGAPKPSDDLAGGRLDWFKLGGDGGQPEAHEGCMVPEHRPLLRMLFKNLDIPLADYA